MAAPRQGRATRTRGARPRLAVGRGEAGTLTRVARLEQRAPTQQPERGAGQGGAPTQGDHTMELAPGVVTPGWFDTRGVVPLLPLPGSLQGSRCLDIATFDGFWAFELERRGAAEVLAIDILDPFAWDWPANSPTAVIEALER